MKMKMKDRIEDILWDISAFFSRIFYHPKTVSFEFVRENDGSWSGNSAETDKYVYYHIGDFKTGYEVKVKSIEVLRFLYTEERVNNSLLKYQLLEAGIEPETLTN